jgi:hypothetical protein
VNAEEAKAITWGGAALNEAARLRRRNEGMEASDDPHPAPEILPSLVPLWNVWFDCRRTNVVGQDSISGSARMDFDGVERIAAAHGEPVDATFLQRFGILFSAFRLDLDKRQPQGK